MPLSLEAILSLAGFIAAYLSWKRIAMGNAYDRETVLRDRLENSANLTDHYYYQLSRVQVAELGGWGYEIWKYLPVIGGIRGKTVVYLYFGLTDKHRSPDLPSEDEILNYPRFEQLGISKLTWKDDVENMPEGHANLELIFDSVDPDEVAKSIADLSDIILEMIKSD